MDTNLEQVRDDIQSGEPGQGLQKLADMLRDQQRYSEWFEALKMQARHELGLGIWGADDDGELSLELSRQLEDKLVEACRLVGERMLKDGLIREGYMYLRPVGDPQRARELLLQQPINEDSLDAIVEVAIGQGVHPAWGYQLLLERMGTCNAITTFDTQLQNQNLLERQKAAEKLVQHFYRELLDGIGYAVGEDVVAGQSLGQVLQSHPDLMGEGGYHADPSHLASVVRIARIVDDPATLDLARQLSLYGEGLDPSLQPASVEPFQPYFPAHRMYFEILLKQDETQKNLAHFRKQRHLAIRESEAPDYSFGLEKQFETTETLVELLVRTGSFGEAKEVLADQLNRSAEHQRSRWTAMLFDCCRRSGDFQALKDYGGNHDDPLGFTLACYYQQRQTVPSDQSTQ